MTIMLVSDTAVAGGTALCCGTGRGQILIMKRTKRKVSGMQKDDSLFILMGNRMNFRR